jgi:hypothetical protein
MGPVGRDITRNRREDERGNCMAARRYASIRPVKKQFAKEKSQ